MTQKFSKLLIFLFIIIEVLSFVNYSVFCYFEGINVFFTFFVFIIVAFLNVNKYSKKSIMLLTCIIIFSLISLIFTKGSIGSIISMFNLLLAFLIFAYVDFTPLEKKAISFLLIVFLGISYIRAQNAYYLTMYFKNSNFNSNTIAQLIMISTIILSVFMLQKNIKKIYILLFNIISIFFIIQCQSRGAAISLVLFVALLLFRKKIYNKKTYIVMLVMLVVLGTVFPLVYVYMYNNNVDFKIPFVNKSLYTGREYIWAEAIEGFENTQYSLIFGLGSKFEIYGWDNLNMHNLYWAIIVNFGIVGYIITIVYLKGILYEGTDERYAFAIFPLLLNGYFETAILWPATLVFVCILINSISGSNKDKTKIRRK